MKLCTLCGNEKEPEKQNDSYCRACRSSKNKENRHKAILATGRELRSKNSKGRSPLCSNCKQDKGPGRENESCCKPCKSKRKSELAAKRREEAGLRPYGSGRKPTCCKCNGPKEKDDAGYCNACKGELQRNIRAEKIKSPEFLEQERKKYQQKYDSDAFFRLQRFAHDAVAKAIKKGILVPQPCEVCGEAKVDGHHDDYAKVLDVRWLCRFHHNEHHENERNLTKDK